MATLPGFKALVNLAAGASVSSTNLVLTDAGDHKTFTVPLASAQRYIDRNTAVTVQTSTDGGSTWSSNLAAGTYTLRYSTAQVVLNVALTGGTTYQARLATFNYLAYAAIAQATDITFNGNRAMLDTTVFQGSTGTGWTSCIPGLLSGTFSCKAWMLATGATLYAAHLSAGDLLILSFVAPNGTNAFESYVYTKDTNWHAAVSGLAEEALNFTCDSIISLI